MGQSISEIKAEFVKAGQSPECLRKLYEKYADDTRSGVKNLIAKSKKQEEKLCAERARLKEMRAFEDKYGEFAYICGIDEVGRGPLAGPVVAGAVILPKDCEILWINDSKKLSAKKREELYEEICEKAVATGIGVVEPERIDKINILQATYEAMRMAIASLKVAPQILLNDAVTIPDVSIPQVPIVKGDAKSVSIAAASILAKVTRDAMMEKYDEVYPGYGFAQNKGYGSREHIEALKKRGPLPIHRRSFIGNFINEERAGEHGGGTADFPYGRGASAYEQKGAAHAGENHSSHTETGRRYEQAAGEYLKELGFEILTYNYRCFQGEIDIVAKDGSTLVFCEVKYRSDDRSGNPLEAVDERKRRRIFLTAMHYMQEKKISGCPCRFDVIGIEGEHIEHVKNAFEG